MIRKQCKTSGFTLIEVLIALLIIAIALAAVIKTTNDSVRTSIHVRNTMVAHWVAMNLLSSIHTGTITLPASGHPIYGTSKMLHQSWQWAMVADPSIKIVGSERVQVRVGLKNKVITSVSGFIRP